MDGNIQRTDIGTNEKDTKRICADILNAKASFIGYIKITDDKSDYNIQYEEIMEFGVKNDINISCIYVDSSFENIKSIVLPNYQGVIISNIICLGARLPIILDNLRYCRSRNLDIYSVAENYHFTTELLSEDVIKGIELALDIRYNMASAVTKRALAKKKTAGFTLGRQGRYNRKRILSGREDEVYRLLKSDMPKIKIAKEFNVSVASLYNFLKRNSINKEDTHA